MPSRKAAELSGRIAETFAAFVLRLSGYRILARRWRCSAGELDIVACRGSTLVFVEVKYRHSQAQWYGLTAKQKRRISRAAALFVSSRQISRRFDWRFDVILLQTDPAAWPKWWQHIKNAWFDGD
ncbi:MAG: YraN family protein [Candidatus Puniceispirillaceae bacterium]